MGKGFDSHFHHLEHVCAHSCMHTCVCVCVMCAYYACGNLRLALGPFFDGSPSLFSEKGSLSEHEVYQFV